MRSRESGFLVALVWMCQVCLVKFTQAQDPDLLLTVVGPCNSAPCLNAGSCTVTSYLTSTYSCHCLHGFTGLNCELGIDECASSPCHNGACIDNIGSFRCHCFPGFTGQLCETDVDECASAPCEHGGTCIQPAPGQFMCECGRGYRGMTCETDINECLSLSPCQHGGSCTEGPPGTYLCSCPAGYTGTDCETDIDPCDPNPCQHGGHCVTDAELGFRCQCTEGHQGQMCSATADACASSPCGQGTCVTLARGGYRCECGPGWSGRNCQTVRDICSSQTCSGHGTCRNHHGNFYCSCEPGYTGPTCETNLTCFHHEAYRCRNGGTCTLINDHHVTSGQHSTSDHHAKCICPEGFQGSACQDKLDPCLSFPCLHNGTCQTGSDSFRCTCLPDFTGFNCQFQNSSGNSTRPAMPGGFLIFGRHIDPTSLLAILGILLSLATVIITVSLVIRRCQLHKPQDFCFSFPTYLYPYFDRSNSAASSGRFQRGGNFDSDEYLHDTTSLRY
ncbi:fibropellin-1-like [Physella acuta]|uniref:fibropellin-1-like n=1 Tax=Physella acuta TaxID=109671 RepID=UPI0027DB4369|nr:fibropellin-1-like [Physella acuta]